MWDWFVVRIFKGESIALLGPRSSGKTTLHRYILETGESDTPEATLAAVGTTWNRNKELALNIRKGVDLPGGSANYVDWEEQFKKSEKVFYLFDAHRARTENAYASFIKQDGKKLREWSTALGGGRRVTMLGTHSDEDPMAEELGAASYRDHIIDLDVVAAFHTRAGVQSFATGSLETREKAVALLKTALGRS